MQSYTIAGEISQLILKLERALVESTEPQRNRRAILDSLRAQLDRAEVVLEYAIKRKRERNSNANDH